ncbi:MAG: DUF3667 domain-containing protein [Saprospiraceae bacterium]|nr:DUF3667 domain-containing protein [Saprospiraceae bacterium]MCF8249965.1 DUF3667 domain-containing protein [Saprospiraceae bacterium]MCF8278995.1 DUF3667 domain-containing protein [Bacteroidales bacterium]MCF8310978.1 DUF3667 domain-containing protein [Saprospiraceae bacterium]MCF8439686.1 DUF3667 domain-containing protein [Saprospiraceae bacterium]
MENETPVQICRNCQSPLPEGAKFCPICSQRNHDGRVTFREFIAGALENLLNLDNRIFSTLKALLIPGKLTVDYFEGKHVRYYHPLRLFFVTGLVLISILTMRYRQGEVYAQTERTIKRFEESQFLQKQIASLDSVRLALQPELGSAVERQALDTFFLRADIMGDTMDTDSTHFNVGLNHKGVKVATKDFMELSADSLLNKYKVQGFGTRILISQLMRMAHGANDFFLSLFGNAIWMMLVMMPLLALFLLLLYYRKHYFYYEHLVFSLHVHSAAFLLAALLAIFYKMSVGVVIISMLLMIIYPFLAMLRVYKQGIFKTLLKYIILSFAYLFLAIGSVFFLLFVSFVLF